MAFSLDDTREGDALAAALSAHPDARVRIEAFTASTGDAVTDESSALARAEGLKDHLISEGIGGERIEAVGRVLPQQAAPQRIDVIITR